MRKFFTLIVFAALLLFGKSSLAQSTDIFIKIVDGSGKPIEGESQDRFHPKEIMASSFGQDNTGCSSIGGGAGTCGGKVGHFVFNMLLSKAVPLLNKELFLGKPLKTVDIVFRKKSGTTSGFEYYKIHLETVAVTHITNAGDNTSALTVQVELDAGKSGWSYIAQKADGSPDTPVKFGWDAIQNREWTTF